MYFEKVSCKGNRPETGAAAHAGEMEALHITMESESVDDHGSNGRCRAEYAAVGYENVNGCWVYLVLGEEILEGCAHDGFHLEEGQFGRAPGREFVEC